MVLIDMVSTFFKLGRIARFEEILGQTDLVWAAPCAFDQRSQTHRFTPRIHSLAAGAVGSLLRS